MSVELAPAHDVRLPLPKPRRHASAFLRLLGRRRSARSFSDQELDPQMLADLLWAASGISSREGYRTAPSARNWREIDIYVALARGLYRYDAFGGDLVKIDSSDLRARTGQQDFVGAAPVNLVYVADHDRMSSASPKERDFYAPADAGAICQNVYLFCASSGLATVVRGLIDRPALAEQMKLRPTQRIILAQTVGYPRQ
jgi:SagB-type dehydrogenase family enzyme